MRQISNKSARAGFTLIELMITVAIIAILAAIALPSYRQYMMRGYVTDAVTGLSIFQAQMERYYQDNRTYANVSTSILSPCDAGVAVSGRTQGNFVISCAGGDAPTLTTYTLRATGSGPVTGFVYTVDQTNNKTSTFTGMSGGWTTPSPNVCWATKPGQAC